MGNPATVSMTLESPPLVCYGHPKDSTGALISGLLHLGIHTQSLRVQSFKMDLQAEILTRRPIAAHCPNCTARTEDIHTWTIISEPVTLVHGINSYPFSYIIPGNLPATNSNALGRIRYFLKAVALSAQGNEIRFSREIQISRAILPGPERHSVRIFPPTNLSAHVNLPHIVHPDGDFQLDIRLDGVMSPDKETRWKLKKVSWRIDESSKIISPSCSHHQSKLCGNGKGMLHEDVCTVGSGELKSGWKADYSNSGRIEMEIIAGMPAHMNAACDIESACGIKVSHNLVVEMIVAEEHCPKGTSNRLGTQVGAARILRMQFLLHVSARAGLGISWDEEQPPLYDNIPPGPPKYQTFIEGAVEPRESPPVYEGIPM
ncbi:hypothetical protein L211DRAFT_775973 [Terfezia boudieri ATCC MYA-4762]|uniref:LDB19 N-terminal domain-containing protein n=1 Tax=Terfezia boudieri ATCC MYA-4762 TaxID=1051890 RepID=A0A3N4M471_9PEZI|nr:hypothetical protein L211DRAFT_775973 [Terfezia boudieri ATCC MYA-4762]